MYHELAVPKRGLCRREPGYIRYVVSVSEFRSQMDGLAREGWHVKNASQAMQSFGNKSVCITFDDGCETDLLFAAPILKDLGLGATFYITTGFVGKSGYMSGAQVRSLSALGFELGCHSLTHPYLTDIDGARLQVETAAAKDQLEQIAGVPIEHFSCPGGRWNPSVIKAVKEANFRTMATSRTGINIASTDPFALARVAVLNGTTRGEFLRTCRGQGLLWTQFQEKARDTAKRVLGNSTYDSLRGLILGREQSSDVEQE
jgi:peptidoglycan/xylan/chitin deacetylase (PgdA/CDA1 family)